MLLHKTLPGPTWMRLCKHNLCRLVECFVFAFLLAVSAHAAETRGLPFIRTYPLDEIGNVPRGLRLGFDAFGRIAVMYDGIYSVLNDTAWVNRIDSSSDQKIRMTTIKFVGKTYYYGGRGSWGTIAMAADGGFRAQPLVPRDAPLWTSVTAFNSITPTTTGVYFYDYNGVVYWDFAQKRNFYFELPRLTALFLVGERVFVSCQDNRLREIVPAEGSIHLVSVKGIDGNTVRASARLDETSTLLALQDGSFISFDGEMTTPWAPAEKLPGSGVITAMERLIGGGVAVAINGKGVFLVSATGEVISSLTLPEFQRVGALAAGEQGVLWAAGENAIQRVLYDSPLTSFGQQLGLSAYWPTVVDWDGKIIVSSNRVLYELKPSSPGVSAMFEAMKELPKEGAECVAASGSHLIMGSPTAVYSRETGGSLTPVIAIQNVSGFVFLQPDLCLALGSRQIATLKYADGKWTEARARIEGVGDAPIRTRFQEGALWIEMGADRVARLEFKDGVLELQRIPLPWPESQWTNVGIAHHTVIFSGTHGQRAYMDETSRRFRDAPELDELLNRSPYWITRVTEDAVGTLWATHSQGVVTFTRKEGGYDMDASTFELRNDSYPSISILPGNSIWVTAGRSLYHVERPVASRLPPPRPVLVSTIADDLNQELLRQPGTFSLPSEFNFEENSLSFRLFSGTYAWRYPPVYEYRLGQSEPWAKVESNLLLHFPKLRDGAYRLEVRPATHTHDSASSISFGFVIKPPWYRAPLSYLTYILLSILSIISIARWINHRTLKRNADLEKLVQERTSQLEATIGKLAEESRNTATLAERNRLAAELHDSVQQGLSGSILQLDTTLAFGTIPKEMLSRLNIVRKMLSFTREEIQHAVWNLGSSLLQNSDLGGALQQLASLINSGTIEMRVTVPPEPISLEPTVKQHLLRIAQEAITNAVKHANATHIEVTLDSNPEMVVLTVRDDGIGFDTSTRPQSDGHFGLRGLRTRAKSIKASLVVKSTPGSGTTVLVTVPKSIIHSHASNGKN